MARGGGDPWLYSTKWYGTKAGREPRQLEGNQTGLVEEAVREHALKDGSAKNKMGQSEPCDWQRQMHRSTKVRIQGSNLGCRVQMKRNGEQILDRCRLTTDSLDTGQVGSE